jgi:PKD repeat protein
MNNLNKILSLLFLGLIIGCNPQEDDKINLGTPPSNVTFDVVQGDNPNSFILKNTTQGTFIHQWDLGNGATAEGEEVTADYLLKGTYTITLSAFNEGGRGEATTTITVDEDAPTPCLKSDPFFEFLTSNSARAWVMNPDEVAYWVGPTDGSATWWQNDQNTVAERPCAFDDEWIFDADCVMEYDTKGDVWAEDYMGFDFECISDAQLNDGQKEWGSGVHSFAVTSGGVTQLTITGLGAFIGLPKVANGAEVTQPQIEITYDVINYEERSDRYYMELEINMGAGIWRFQLISYK